MAPPTRPQIEAAVTLPIYQLQRWDGAVWTDVTDADVSTLKSIVDTGGGASGFDFGANAAPSATITLLASSTNIAISWERMRVRIQYGFSTSDMVTRWQGIVIDCEYSTDGGVLSWKCDGFHLLIAEAECYSNALFRRPPATKTTLTSIEDPTNGAYAAGLINFILWQAGGRPYEQSATYTTAVFYYSLDNAIITPEWTWISGENGWQEIDTLCRAVGGQVYQDTEGTIVYRNPLIGTASGYTFTTAVVSSAKVRGATRQKTGTARCAYKARRLQPEQDIYSDTTPRLVKSSSAITVVLDMQKPIYDYAVSAPGGSGIPDSGFNCVTLDGYPVVYSDVIVTYTQRAAGRCAVQISNTLTQPIVLTNLTLRGRPLAVTEDGQASYGASTPVREVGNGSIYIQSRNHAERLCRLYVDVYSTARLELELTCMYDPDRVLSEIVTVTIPELSISGSYRITAIDETEGAMMVVRLRQTTGLLTTADLFIIGTSYTTETRQLSW